MSMGLRTGLLTLAFLAVGAPAHAQLTVTITTPANNFTECVGVPITFDCNPSAACITFDWNWGDGTAHGNTKRANHTFQSAGAYNVRVTVTTAGGANANNSITVNILGGNFNNVTYSLRYYCGEPVPAPYQDTCTAAAGQPAGTTYTWATSANMKASAGQGTATATVQGQAATNGGVGSETVSLTYALNGKTCTSRRNGWTVYVPSNLQRTSTTNEAWGVGFWTTINYTIRDQFNNTMPRIAVNDSTNGWTSDFAGENWPTDPLISLTTANGTFSVNMDYANAAAVPPTMNPQTPLGAVKVWHTTQTWKCGSLTAGKGCTVQTNTAQYYRDHGDHQ